MTTRNINLTDMLDRYVAESVGSGAYQNASEVIRDALRLHKARADEEARKLERFKMLAQEGISDIAEGRFEDVEDVADWLSRRGR